MSFDNNKVFRSFDLETELIEVLGEEMYRYCVENPNRAITFRGLLSLSVADFDKEHEIDSVISNALSRIQEELGEELCVWYANNHKGLADILILLNDYINIYEDARKFRERLKLLISNINAKNNNAKIIPLVSAFGTEDKIVLLKCIKGTNIENVKDLDRILLMTIDEEEKVPLVKFIEWLGKDWSSIIINELNKLFKKDRDKKVIRQRAEGVTLEETSKGYAITHEGVRQIEKKYQDRFNRYVCGMMPHYIIYAFSQNISYISIQDIRNQLGDSANIFIYCLKKSNCSTAHWAEELEGFIIGDGKWYEQLQAYKKELPDMLDCELLDEMIIDIIGDLEMPTAFKDIEKIVLTDYYLSGKLYLKKRIGLFRIYKYVLKKFYPYGINLYDDAEIAYFRNYVHDLFGNVYLPENNRAIVVRLTEITILCNRGKRILPSGIRILPDLLRRIHDKILESDRDEILFSTLFNSFKDDLLQNSNISNKYFLQGVLKLRYAKEFDFTRYTVKKKVKKEFPVMS